MVREKQGEHGTPWSTPNVRPADCRQALRESEERWRSLVEYAPARIVILDREGTIVHTNRATEGHSIEEVIGTTIYSFLVPQHRMRARKALKAVFESGERRTYQAEAVLLDGAEAWVDNSVWPICSDGQISAAMLVSIDVTDRNQAEHELDRYRRNLETLVEKRTEELACANQELRIRIAEQRQAEHVLRESEKRYRELADLLPQFVFEIDERGVLGFLNRAGIQSSGYTQGEVEKGLEIFELLIPEDRGRAQQNTLEMLCGGVSVGTEYTVLRKDGTTFPVVVYSSAITRDGNPVGLRGVAIDVTERKQAENALQLSETRFRSLVERASDVVIIVDGDINVSYVSPAVKRTFGYDPDELVGEQAFSYVHPDDVQDAAEHFAQLTQEGGVFERGEYRVRHKDGSWRIAEATGANLLDVLEVGGIVVNFQDVTERKLAEKAAQDTTEELRDVLKNSVDMIYRLNLETGEYEYASPSSKDVIGRSPEEFLAMGLEKARSLTHPDDLSRLDADVIQMVMQTSVGGAYSSIDYRYEHKELGYRWVSDSRSVVFNDRGLPVAVVGTLRDIHDRKTAEMALRESEKRFRELAELLPQLVFETDLAGDITFVNRRVIERLGYSKEDIRNGVHAFQMLVPEERDRARGNMTRVLNGESVGGNEYTALRKDGTTFPMTVYSAAIIRDGTPAGLRGVAVDITERNEMLRALQLSEKRFRALVERASDVTMILDSNMQVSYVSPAVKHTFGYDPEELAGDRAFSYLHPDDARVAAERFARLVRNGGVYEHQEYRVQHKDGSWRTIEAVASNLLGVPEVGGIVVNFHDVTERRVASERLREHYEEERKLREQLEAEIEKRVEFSRGLAHELKTPLTPLIASTDLLLAQAQDERLLSLANSIRRGASNLSRRVDEILDLARGEVSILELQIESVDVLQLVREAAGGMVPLASKQGQSIVLRLPRSLPLIQADPTRVHQVVGNLLDNAVKFTPRDGQITLTARLKNSSVVVEVRDSGRGIPTREQARLFEPYQRLQGDGRQHGGIGLGLSLSKMFVELHGGEIWVRSRPGRGSTFGFSLPLPADGEKVIGR
jgi:PAS domain S-box-containing protein